jgi:RHS repeat-associated protein
MGSHSNAHDNLTADGLGDTYTWDDRNHLSQAVTSSLAVKPTYDAFGRRQKFLDYTNNSYTVSFLYDGLNPVHEQNTNGNNADLLTGLGLDEVFTRTDNSGTMSFLRDKLNSTVALTDSSGTVQDEYNYGPFGDTNGGQTNANPYQWTGRENDPSGLYYMRARYYHPTLQRFLSPDPAGFGGGDVNLFRYAGNSPTNFSDPVGLSGGPAPAPVATYDPTNHRWGWGGSNGGYQPGGGGYYAGGGPITGAGSAVGYLFESSPGGDWTLALPIMAPPALASGGLGGGGGLRLVVEKRYDLPNEFWSWYHRQIKKPGDPDLDKGQAEWWFNQWLREGKPNPEGHSTEMSPVFIPPFPDLLLVPPGTPIGLPEPVLVF